jgi:hypothetical protein
MGEHFIIDKFFHMSMRELRRIGNFEYRLFHNKNNTNQAITGFDVLNS